MKPANHGIKHELRNMRGMRIAVGYPVLSATFPKPGLFHNGTVGRPLYLRGNTCEMQIFSTDTLRLVYDK